MSAPIRISRRGLLGLAAGAASTPFVSFTPREARASAPARTRLILVMQSNGTSQSSFWPNADFVSPVLEPIVRHPRLRAKTTVIKGIFNHGGGAGNSHDQGFAGLWSGLPTTGSFDDPWGAGPSLDQILRRNLAFAVPFPTLNCGVLASNTPPIKEHRLSFSYLGPKQQVPTEVDVYKLYRTFFAHGEDPAVVQRRLLQRRSVLDYASKDLARARARLGKHEQDKLDIHATAIREYEQRLSMLASRPLDPRCAAAQPSSPGLDVRAEVNVPALMAMMVDFTALALACRLTQVVTLQLGGSGEKWRFSWLEINRNSHDDICHRDDGKTPEITALLVKMNRFYAENVARLALALDAIPEGEGTMLDNTLIVWGNEQATGQHGLDDIPIALLGGASGQLKKTGVVVDEGPQDYHRLGCTVANLMGHEVRGFGDQPECGPVRGLAIA